MIRLAANLSTLFTELPFLERFGAAAAAGFRHVECQFPYAETAPAVRAALDRHGLTLELFNTPPGDAAKGERGLAALPGREAEFRAALATALDWARALGCPRLHVMAGLVPPGGDREAHRRVFVHNLREAAPLAAAADVTLLIEPINTRIDVPGYFLDGSAQAAAILDEVGAPNVKLQFDVYHLQVMEGDLARRFEQLLPRIGHVQVADNPGRHEPGTGEIHFSWLLSRMDALGWDGFVGCEYFPSGRTEDGLGWARGWLALAQGA